LTPEIDLCKQQTRAPPSLPADRTLRYFQAAYPTSVQRQIFSVSLPQSADGSGYTAAEPYPLTNSKTQSYYFAKFSVQCGFYRLNYEGPDIPRQQIRNTASNGEYCKSKLEKVVLSFFVAVIRILESNPQLASKQGSLTGADIILSTIEVDGFGELCFRVRIIVGPVIDFVILQSST